MLRRLHPEQPESFAFTPDNQAWADAQIQKYPDGRAASAIIPLLWRAQEQEGWLTRPAIEHIAGMLDLAYIRALEVATFYFMFQLQPVGSVAHIQICGTTSCMICGAEDLVGICKEKIAPKAHQLSADGKFSWEEVECLGACANAPMAQIGKDYYEDLTADKLVDLLDRLAKGEVPVPGPQNGRFASEPKAALSSLKEYEEGRNPLNASADLATRIGDTVKRIDGTEVPLIAPWLTKAADHGSRSTGGTVAASAAPAPTPAPKPAARPAPKAAAEKPAEKPVEKTAPKAAATPAAAEKPAASSAAEAPAPEGVKPAALTAARDGKADDLKLIKGVGPKLEKVCNALGFYHFDQIAAWTEAEIAWVDENLEGFKGRVTRDTWVEQAKKLAAGEETDFAKRAKKDGIYD